MQRRLIIKSSFITRLSERILLLVSSQVRSQLKGWSPVLDSSVQKRRGHTGVNPMKVLDSYLYYVLLLFFLTDPALFSQGKNMRSISESVSND